jgi:hypothetical protein
VGCVIVSTPAAGAAPFPVRTGRRRYRVARIAAPGTRIQCRILGDAAHILVGTPDPPALHMDGLRTAGFSLAKRRGMLPDDSPPLLDPCDSIGSQPITVNSDRRGVS